MAYSGSASVNGFTLKKVKRFFTQEGCYTSAVLCYRGKKIGDYVNEGRGVSYYHFLPAEGYSEERIMEVLLSFPMIVRYEHGKSYPPVFWDIGILVDGIIRQNSILKSFRKAQKNGNIIVVACSESFGKSFIFPVCSDLDDSQAINIAMELSEKYEPDIRDFSFKVYRKAEETNIIFEGVPELSFPGRSASV